MRILLCSCLITVALGLSPVVALGDAQSHRTAAENLLIVMEVDKSLPKIVDQVVATQLQQNPQLASQREVLQRFLTQCEHWESVKEDTITVYTQEFTEPELKKLTEFYKTPWGRKPTRKCPTSRSLRDSLVSRKPRRIRRSYGRRSKTRKANRVAAVNPRVGTKGTPASKLGGACRVPSSRVLYSRSATTLRCQSCLSLTWH